jgi:outer membrane protein OmpA-like peptidoglycan-associated protein
VVLGGIAQKAQSGDGLTQLMALLNRPELNTAVLDNVGGLFDFGGNGIRSLIQFGTSTLLPALFGDKADGLATALAGMSDIKNSSATSLIAMAAPLLLTVIKKYVGQNNLNAASLAALLKDQRQYLSGELDNRLTGALGFANPTAFLGSLGGTLGSGTRVASSAAAVPGKSGLMRWLPWLIAIAVLLAVWNMFSRKPETPVPTPTPAQAPSASAPAPVMAAFPYKVHFDVGSAVLGADASATLSAAAEAIRKNGVKVALTGYTDRSGDVTSNEALAKSRALAVRDALMAAGIAEGDIEMRPPMFVEASAGGDDAQARRVEINPR